MRILAAAAFAAALAPGLASAEEIGVTIPTRPGATETFVYDSLDSIKAAAVLLPGGPGLIGIDATGTPPALKRGGNFLVRMRAAFAEEGVAVAALDAPSDRSGGIDEDFRKSDLHAQDIGAVVEWLKKRAQAPVWLIGTSMGSISAASAAIELGAKIDGLVLTSSVSAKGRNSPGGGVSSLDLGAIAVPVLVMDHAAEACPSSPLANAPAIAKKMAKSPRVEVKIIDGGKDPESGPCDPFSAHGYFGVEDKAVDAIVGFILAK